MDGAFMDGRKPDTPTWLLTYAGLNEFQVNLNNHRLLYGTLHCWDRQTVLPSATARINHSKLCSEWETTTDFFISFYGIFIDTIQG